MTSIACLLMSGLNSIFHCPAQLVILSKSSVSCSCVSCIFRTLIKRDESSAKSRMFDDILSVRSLMYIRKRSGPRTDPCGTPDWMDSQDDSMPFKTTLCLRLLRKSDMSAQSWPSMPLLLSLNNKPSCHTLSNALEMSRKDALVISISRSWYIVESPGRKPDWCFEINSFSTKNYT